MKNISEKDSKSDFWLKKDKKFLFPFFINIINFIEEHVLEILGLGKNSFNI